MTSGEEALVSVRLSESLTVEMVKAYFLVYFSINTPWSGTERRLYDVVVRGVNHTQYSWMNPATYMKQMMSEVNPDVVYQACTTTYRAAHMFAVMHAFVQDNESQFINDDQISNHR